MNVWNKPKNSLFYRPAGSYRQNKRKCDMDRQCQLNSHDVHVNVHSLTCVNTTVLSILHIVGKLFTSQPRLPRVSWALTYLLIKYHWGILTGGPQLADRAETADQFHHIRKDATDRYAPCLRGGPFTCVVLVGAL